jgi:hypothetical protein
MGVWADGTIFTGSLELQELAVMGLSRATFGL